jgi:hypothetical protein
MRALNNKAILVSGKRAKARPLRKQRSCVSTINALIDRIATQTDGAQQQKITSTSLSIPFGKVIAKIRRKI